jgi:hypothetical protein
MSKSVTTFVNKSKYTAPHTGFDQLLFNQTQNAIQQIQNIVSAYHTRTVPHNTIYSYINTRSHVNILNRIAGYYPTKNGGR